MPKIKYFVFFLTLACLFPWKYFFAADMDLLRAKEAPSLAHWLGTDHLGRDLLVRLHFAAISAMMVLIAGSVGAFLGLLLFSLKLCSFLRFSLRPLLGVLGILPFWVLPFLFSISFGYISLGGIVGTTLLLSFGFFWTEADLLYKRDARLLYWEAYDLLGGGFFTKIWKLGILGGWSEELLRLLSQSLAGFLIAEISLSYLGFGIPEPHASFGGLFASYFSEILHGDAFAPFVITLGTWVFIRLPSCLILTSHGHR